MCLHIHPLSPCVYSGSEFRSVPDGCVGHNNLDLQLSFQSSTNPRSSSTSCGWALAGMEGLREEGNREPYIRFFIGIFGDFSMVF